MNKRPIFITVGILIFIVSFVTVYFTIFEYLVAYGLGFIIGLTCCMFLLKTVGDVDEPRLYTYEEFVGMADPDLYHIFYNECFKYDILDDDIRRTYYDDNITRFSDMLKKMFNDRKNK